MTAITAGMVKELRERTGAGMMDCKKALVGAAGDMEKAEDILAASGAKKAAKSASRVAAEGVVLASVSADNTIGVLLEINCETDFVSKDAGFMAFAKQVSDVLLKQSIDTVEALAQARYDDKLTIEQARENLIAKVGENIQLRRLTRVQAEKGGCVAAYMHDQRIGVLLALDKPQEGVARDLAMQVAAMRPQYIAPKDVPQNVIDREKAILVERAKDSTKPAEILEKIMAGQLNKYLNELSLVGQPFIKNPNETVESLLKANQATVTSMVRFEVGEGIVVEKKSFLEEVMEQVSKTE